MLFELFRAIVVQFDIDSSRHLVNINCHPVIIFTETLILCNSSYIENLTIELQSGVHSLTRIEFKAIHNYLITVVFTRTMTSFYHRLSPEQDIKYIVFFNQKGLSFLAFCPCKSGSDKSEHDTCTARMGGICTRMKEGGQSLIAIFPCGKGGDEETADADTKATPDDKTKGLWHLQDFSIRLLISYVVSCRNCLLI